MRQCAICGDRGTYLEQLSVYGEEPDYEEQFCTCPAGRRAQRRYHRMEYAARMHRQALEDRHEPDPDGIPF